ncbi:hypothetical protein L837_3749 [Mycobacterium avium MAV_061107_1842]|nr:hypothetical protein L837_3749 [Mycobacterium avium MAV_061107_1842]
MGREGEPCDDAPGDAGRAFPASSFLEKARKTNEVQSRPWTEVTGLTTTQTRRTKRPPRRRRAGGPGASDAIRRPGSGQGAQAFSPVGAPGRIARRSPGKRECAVAVDRLPARYLGRRTGKELAATKPGGSPFPRDIRWGRISR